MRTSVTIQKLSLRAASRLDDIPYARRHRYILCVGNVSVHGRLPCLEPAEEQMITDAALDFARSGTPLSRECLKDLMQHFIGRLPLQRQTKLPFRECRPGDRYFKSFMTRNPSISMKRRCNLEKDRAIAMSPHNLAEHFARLQQLYKEIGINSGAQIFNPDESGFSTLTAFRAREKAAMERQGRSNSTELKWAGNAAHVTIMLVVPADGTVWTPVAILPGKRAKYRIREDGSRETPASYLPENVKVAYRDRSGMDSAMFSEFCQNFVLETASLRRKYKNLVLTMDGYGAHTT